MLDKQATSVLNIINSISDGSYKIVDADEIISKLGESEKASKIELVGIMRTLVDYELVKVKYSTLDEYCLAALPKARIVEDKVRIGEDNAKIIEDTNPTIPDVALSHEAVPKVTSSVDYGFIKKAVKKAAFYGAFFGGIIVGIIGIIIGFFIKK